VPGAASYAVEVDYFETGGWNSARTGGVVHDVPNMAAPTYAIDFVGQQFGRWRVWAVDAKGRPGARSPWLRFTWDTAPRAAGPDGVTPPRSVYAPNPEYPPGAARDKIAGQVLLNVTVGADGLVNNAVVLKSLRRDLDDAALRTVKSWRFEPARRDDVPIERTITVEIGFYVR
jgi:TonB family protein